MRQYEMTYLISDKVSDNEMNAATGKINGLITEQGGKVLREENWGRRKLAYPINKQEFATYITLNFELEPENLASVNRELRLSKDVVRSLILVKDYGKEALKLTAEEIAEAGEIKEVVGGERSFEAVEGETEESYELMAKREESTEELKDEETKEPKEEEKVVEAEAVEEVAETPKKKTTKKAAAKLEEAEEAKKESSEPEFSEVVEEKKEKKPAAKKTAEKSTSRKNTAGDTAATGKKESAKPEAKEEGTKKAEEEADRLAKLDEEIEGILGDDL